MLENSLLLVFPGVYQRPVQKGKSSRTGFSRDEHKRQ